MKQSLAQTFIRKMVLKVAALPNKELVDLGPASCDYRTSGRIVTPPSASPMKISPMADKTSLERPLAAAIDSLWTAAREMLVCNPQTSKWSIFRNSGCLTKQPRRLQHRTRRWSKITARPPRVMAIWLECSIARYLKIHSRVSVRELKAGPHTKAYIICVDNKKTFKSAMEAFHHLRTWPSAGFTICRQAFPSSILTISWRRGWYSGSHLVPTHPCFTGKTCPRWPRPLTWMRFRKSGQSVTTWRSLITRSRSLRRCVSAWSPWSWRSHGWKTTRKIRCT